MTEAIILAGGLGTRLRGAAPGVPKPLAEVGGRPFLDILMDQLGRSGCVDRVILAVGYRACQIIERYDRPLDYPFEIVFSAEDEPLGTGGAVLKGAGLCAGAQVLVLNGDSFVEIDIGGLLAFHGENRSPFTVVLREVRDCSRYGRVEVNMEGRVVSFSEKPGAGGPGLVNAGMYALDRGLLEAEQRRAASLEAELIPGWLKHGGYGYVVHGRFIDIGVPEAYRAAGQYLRGTLQG